jgi:hypothetical protein
LAENPEKAFSDLALILDLSSRKCIGWDLDRNMGLQLAMNALAKALEIAGQIQHMT